MKVRVGRSIPLGYIAKIKGRSARILEASVKEWDRMPATQPVRWFSLHIFLPKRRGSTNWNNACFGKKLLWLAHPCIRARIVQAGRSGIVLKFLLEEIINKCRADRLEYRVILKINRGGSQPLSPYEEYVRVD